jgi:tetratricopeptide (TPR) repeat protein
MTCFIIYADKVYTQNKKANKLYEQGNYDDALEIYHDALLESPENKKLSMNKGSAYYQLEEYEKAKENYERALSVEDQKAKASLLYNMGNVLNKQGDQLASSGSQEAMEKFKAARDSYIHSLDIDPNDKDAKWNLQLTQMKIKEMEKQQQQQQNKDNKDNKDQKDRKDQDKQQQDRNKDKQDQKKDQRQDKDKQDKEKEKKQQQQNQQKQEEEKKQSEEKPAPKPEKSEEEMKKEEAMRLLMQYADDADELNKPKKKAAVIKGKKSEKDW